MYFIGTCVWRTTAVATSEKKCTYPQKTSAKMNEFKFVLHTHVTKKCTYLDLSLRYIVIIGTCPKFARKHHFLALGVLFPVDMLKRWPHVCRVEITFQLLPTNWFVSKSTKSIGCLVNWGEVGGWGRDPFSRNFMKPTPRRKWYLTTGRRFH